MRWKAWPLVRLEEVIGKAIFFGDVPIGLDDRIGLGVLDVGVLAAIRFLGQVKRTWVLNLVLRARGSRGVVAGSINSPVVVLVLPTAVPVAGIGAVGDRERSQLNCLFAVLLGPALSAGLRGNDVAAISLQH